MHLGNHTKLEKVTLLILLESIFNNIHELNMFLFTTHEVVLFSWDQKHQRVSFFQWLMLIHRGLRENVLDVTIIDALKNRFMLNWLLCYGVGCIKRLKFCSVLMSFRLIFLCGTFIFCSKIPIVSSSGDRACFRSLHFRASGPT